jgi:hypothetical protein
MMISLFDQDRSGTINFQEFQVRRPLRWSWPRRARVLTGPIRTQGLWNYVNEWRRVFQGFDRGTWLWEGIATIAAAANGVSVCETDRQLALDRRERAGQRAASVWVHAVAPVCEPRHLQVRPLWYSPSPPCPHGPPTLAGVG